MHGVGRLDRETVLVGGLSMAQTVATSQHMTRPVCSLHVHSVNSSILAFRAVLRSVCRVMKTASKNPGLTYGSPSCLHSGCTSLLAALRLCRGRRGKMWCSIWNCRPP